MMKNRYNYCTPVVEILEIDRTDICTASTVDNKDGTWNDNPWVED